MSPSLRAIRWRLILTSLLALVLALGAFYLNQWAYAPSDDQCTWEVQDQRVLVREELTLQSGSSHLLARDRVTVTAEQIHLN